MTNLVQTFNPCIASLSVSLDASAEVLESYEKMSINEASLLNFLELNGQSLSYHIKLQIFLHLIMAECSNMFISSVCKRLYT